VPYLISTKVIKKGYRERKKSGEWVDHPPELKSQHRWLCGVQTGRDCAAVWHQKFREWKSAKSG